MEVSKVTLSSQTKYQMMNNPLLKSRKAKSKFRQERIKDYIRSKPSGHYFAIGDLVAAGGYDMKQYGTGWAFVKRMERDGIIVLSGDHKTKKQATIPSDAHVTHEADRPLDKVVESAIDLGQEIERHKVKEEIKGFKESDQPANPVTKGDVEKNLNTIPKEVEEMIFIARIEQLAVSFVWNSGSDSVREFIKSLK